MEERVIAPPPKGARLALIGANSKLARSVAANIEIPTLSIARFSKYHHPEPGWVHLDSYDDLRSDQFAGCKTAVYCIGAHQGGRDLMKRINCDLALTMAQKARNAGVEHFLYISSFSVYGNQSHIIDNSNVAPSTDYGQSRLEAENKLMEYAQAGGSRPFKVSILRLPMLYGYSDSKLEKLLKWISNTRIFIKPARDVRRSMLHYDAAARVINQIVNSPVTEIVTVADEVPFSYSLLQEAALEVNYSLRILTFSKEIQSLMLKIMPSLTRSLFADCLLDPTINEARNFGLSTRLLRDIASNLNGGYPYNE